MMTCFYQASTVLQNIMLFISQFSVIFLATGLILLFKRKSKYHKIISLGAVFLLNVVLYLIMQLDSRITGAEKGLHLHVPYAVLMFVTLASILFAVWVLLNELRRRKTINHRSIKEAFDNLPTGVCFFNDAGFPVLCNNAMQRFSFDICGKDVQFITDLEGCFDEDFVPANEAKKEGKVFVLQDGRAWNLEKRSFTHKSGNTYTQYIATSVTDIHKKRVELQEETVQLRKVSSELQVLSANVMTVTREEEILNTKMRVHDEMGRCLVEARKYLREGCNESIPESVVTSWHRAVSMLKYNNETNDEDMLTQVRKTCDSIKLRFIQTGELPKEESAAYILTCAVRECVTNAVRYAGATELYAEFTENETEAVVTITNNGKAPDSEIIEGGGLSTLRRRVEHAGGRMNIRSYPEFRLTVTVPKRKDDVL